MPKLQRGPDGVIHSFPDAATDDQIAEAMQGLYGAKSSASGTANVGRPAVGTQIGNAFRQAGQRVVDNVVGLPKSIAEELQRPPTGMLDAAGKGVFGPMYGPLRQDYQTRQDLAKRSQERLKAGDKFGATQDALGWAVPVVGPLAADVSENVRTGQFANLAGDVATAMIPSGLKSAAKGTMRVAEARAVSQAKASHNLAVKDLKTAIPPSKSVPYEDMDIRRAAPYLGEQQKLQPITGVEDFIKASGDALSQIEGKVRQYIQTNPQAPITTDPYAAARGAVSNHPQPGAVDAAIRELKRMGIPEGPVPIAQADKLRAFLNAEDNGFLDKNQFTREVARKTSPEFAGREAAADALREGVYGRLEAQGIEGIQQIRGDEGSIIKIRNAAVDKKYSAQKEVAKTGRSGLGRSIAANLVRVGATGAGAGIGGVLGGGPGAAAGGVIGLETGNQAARMIASHNLTRDALITRAFERLKAPTPEFPQMPQTAPTTRMLPPAAREMPAPPDTSFVRGVPAQYEPTPAMRMLPPGTREMGMGPDTSGPIPSHQPPIQPGQRLLPERTMMRIGQPDYSYAQGRVPDYVDVIDPQTHQIVRIYTVERRR